MLRTLTLILATAVMAGFGLMPAAAQSQAPIAPLLPPTPAGFERIELVSKSQGGTTISAYLRRPVAKPPLPIVVSLHGCNGLFNARGSLMRREVDWVDRFVASGYAVLLVDSFNPRGFREVCTLAESERRVRPIGRAQDVAAAIGWIAGNAALDKTRIVLVGWSHGGSSVLWSLDRRLKFEGAEIKTAIAFYPGCRVVAESEAWAPRGPLTILIGDADDWTRPEYCRALVAKHPAIRYIEYPGAVHGFDAPDSPRRTLNGLGLVGSAQIGTDPKARAGAITEVERLLHEVLK